MTDTSADRFDIVVLGAGTGGYTAAFRAAQLGLRTALVDEDQIGGTCLHRGCIPTKALLESADLRARVAKAAEFGVTVDGAVGVDYAVVAARRDAVVKRMTTGLRGLVKRNGVEWVAGRGRLEGPTTVRVALTWSRLCCCREGSSPAASAFAARSSCPSTASSSPRRTRRGSSQSWRARSARAPRRAWSTIARRRTQ